MIDGRSTTTVATTTGSSDGGDDDGGGDWRGASAQLVAVAILVVAFLSK